jgi:hypothetical protein
MDGGRIPPQDDAPTAGAANEVEIGLPDDPRVPQPEDADPRVSKELGGAAPAIGPGRSSGTSGPDTAGSAADADG